MGGGVSEQVEENQKPEEEDDVAQSRGEAEGAVEKGKVVDVTASAALVAGFEIGAISLGIWIGGRGRGGGEEGGTMVKRGGEGEEEEEAKQEEEGDVNEQAMGFVKESESHSREKGYRGFRSYWCGGKGERRMILGKADMML